MNPLSLIGGLLMSFVEDWRAKRENQRNIEKAVADNKIRLAQDTETHNNAWEMAALQGGDNAVRRASFVIWSTPFVWAAWNPEAVRAYFDVLKTALPEWYTGAYLAITGAVWGLAELKARGVIK